VSRPESIYRLLSSATLLQSREHFADGAVINAIARDNLSFKPRRAVDRLTNRRGEDEQFAFLTTGSVPYLDSLLRFFMHYDTSATSTPKIAAGYATIA